MTDRSDETTERTSSGRRARWFVLLCVVCVAGAGGFVAWKSWRAQSTVRGPSPSASGAPTGPSLAELVGGPHLLFRSSAAGDRFGEVTASTIASESPSRARAPLKCDRVHFAHGRGICLLDNRKKIVPPALAILFDADFHELATLPLAGAPSRARVSADGRYAAATVFVTGDDYAATFSTRTSIVDLETKKVVDDLEQFAVTRDDKPFHEVDMNYWGVTFAKDSNRFFATVASKGTTYLIEGNVSEKKARVLHENVECPSLSPDGTRIAYKKRISAETGWQIFLLDLASQEESPLRGETRNIDDQVEWLDDEHVLYGFVGERGSPEEAMNVWMSAAPKVPAPGAPEPILYIHGASSPVVVR